MKKAIIIEDEPAARHELEALLAMENDIQISGHAEALQQAVDLISHQNPDLIFMDINLYDCTAFDILNELEKLPPHIIFVTAYDQYAIKAIRYGALDYLLKPIDEEEFKEAIDRFRNKKVVTATEQQLSLSKEILQKEPRHIALPSLGEVRIVALEDIRYCQGDGPYTHFILKTGKKETVSKPLKFYEALLPERQFIRTHQSYIVRLSFVKSVVKQSLLILDNGDEIPISFRRKNEVLKKLKS